jgi:hypothetical protein
MSARKIGLRVVIPRSNTTSRRQTCLHVAALAKLCRVVAINARRLAIVCRRRVPLQEIRRMEAWRW